jgi:NAD-dependent deacetylase
MTSREARIEFWEMKAEGWDLFRSARPNAVHEACVKLERAGRVERVVTQNIDGLHGRAGTSEEKLVEIHGTESRIACLDCGREMVAEAIVRRFRREGEPPVCACGGFLKSMTISFGQNLRSDDLERAFSSAGVADLVVSLGSSLGVQPAATVPLVAAQRGAPYAIVNLGETEQDHRPEVTLRIEGDVVDVFPPAVDLALAGESPAR